MKTSKLLAVFSLVLILSILLAACQPSTVEKTVVVEQTKIVEGETVVETVVQVVTATPEPEETLPKTMVVCMAQEPATLYTYSEAALVKSAVLEAVYDWGIDTRTYGYQAIGMKELPSFDNGLAVKEEVEVGIGDTVYDAPTDTVVTIAPTSTVTLNQVDGSQITNDFAITPTAKTVQMTVNWTLADGLTWEDGTPVTTADMVFSWDVFGSPDTPSAKYNYDRTQEVTAVDDMTYQWKGMPGYTTTTYFLDGLPFHPLPKHIFGEGGSRPLTPAEMLQDEEVNRDPLAFGPFKLTEWVAGDHITLEKNDTYYRASEGLPLLDTLIYRFVPDTNQLIAQLASGECDLGTQDAAFEGSLPLIRQFEAQGLLIPQVVAGTVYEHLDFDIKPIDSYKGFAGSVKNDDGTPIFANAEIRQAIAMCLDKQAIVDQTTNGAAVVQHVYSPADHPLYAGDENITIFPFDPEAAKALFEKNGWTDSDGDGWLDKGGQKLSFIHSTRTNALREKVTQVVQAQLKDNCGVETTIELYGSEFFADWPDGLVFGRKYDLGEFAWLTGVEPPCNLYQGNQIPSDGNAGGQNNTGWENAEFDAACVAASTALDETVKAEQHALAQKIFSEFLPSIPLFARAKILVTRPEASGVIMDPTANSELWNVENFDLNTGE